MLFACKAWTVVVAAGSAFDALRACTIADGTTTVELLHKLLVLSVDSVATSNPRSIGTCATRTRTVVAPIGTTLTIGTIPGHVPSISTHATDDVGSKVALLGTVVLAVADLTTYDR